MQCTLFGSDIPGNFEDQHDGDAHGQGEDAPVILHGPQHVGVCHLYPSAAVFIPAS